MKQVTLPCKYKYSGPILNISCMYNGLTEIVKRKISYRSVDECRGVLVWRVSENRMFREENEVVHDTVRSAAAFAHDGEPILRNFNEC